MNKRIKQTETSKAAFFEISFLQPGITQNDGNVVTGDFPHDLSCFRGNRCFLLDLLLYFLRFFTSEIRRASQLHILQLIFPCSKELNIFWVIVKLTEILPAGDAFDMLLFGSRFLQCCWDLSGVKGSIWPGSFDFPSWPLSSIFSNCSWYSPRDKTFLKIVCNS